MPIACPHRHILVNSLSISSNIEGCSNNPEVPLRGLVRPGSPDPRRRILPSVQVHPPTPTPTIVVSPGSRRPSLASRRGSELESLASSRRGSEASRQGSNISQRSSEVSRRGNEVEPSPGVLWFNKLLVLCSYGQKMAGWTICLVHCPYSHRCITDPHAFLYLFFWIGIPSIQRNSPTSHALTMKMETACTFKTLVTSPTPTWRTNPRT